MEKINPLTHFIFFIATAFTLWQFYLATKRSKPVLVIIVSWLVLQSLISITGFYTITNTLPPRFVILVAPGLLIPLIMLMTKKGKHFIDSLELKNLTLLHAARIPVEITLYYLFVAGMVPALMTFEGFNYDILSGITAILVYYLVFAARKYSAKLLLAWNIFGLMLLINILFIAVFSVKTPFQKFAFEQPNAGVTYFPFVILPAVIVPLVLFSHLAAIRQTILAMQSPESQHTKPIIQPK